MMHKSNNKNRISVCRVVAILLIFCNLLTCFSMASLGIVADSSYASPLATDSNILASTAASAGGNYFDQTKVVWLDEGSPERTAVTGSTALRDFYYHGGTDNVSNNFGIKYRVAMQDSFGNECVANFGVQKDKGYVVSICNSPTGNFVNLPTTTTEANNVYSSNSQGYNPALYFKVTSSDGSIPAVYSRYNPNNGASPAILEYLPEHGCYKISGLTTEDREPNIRITEYAPFDLTKGSVYIGCNEDYDRYYIKTGEDNKGADVIKYTTVVSGSKDANFEFKYEDITYQNIYETNTFYGKDYNGYVIEGPHVSGSVTTPTTDGVAPAGTYGTKYLVYQSKTTEVTANYITILGKSDENAGVTDLSAKVIPTYDLTISGINCATAPEISLANKNQSTVEGHDTAKNNNLGHERSEYCAGISIPSGGDLNGNIKNDNQRQKRHVVINLEGDNKIGKLHWATNYSNTEDTRDNVSTLVIKSANSDNIDDKRGILEASYRNDTTYNSPEDHYYVWSAVIGGNNRYKDATHMYIMSGTVLARTYGQNFDAWSNAGVGGDTAIGGGPNGYGEVQILGGNVYARTNSTGATIGGGGGFNDVGADGKVVINGGNVYAYNEGIGVGIGAGSTKQSTGNNAEVKINGGNIVVETYTSTAIGGGYSESMDGGIGTIFITGGYISSTKGMGGGSTDNVMLYGSKDSYSTNSTKGDPKEGTGEIARGGDAIVTIQGGTIKMLSIGGGKSKTNGYENATIRIDGGSINSMMTAVPTSNNRPVYRNIITVFDTNGNVEANKQISSTEFSHGFPYRIHDVRSDEEGMLYFYFPQQYILASA